jgi:hypothetical protein
MHKTAHIVMKILPLYTEIIVHAHVNVSFL